MYNKVEIFREHIKYVDIPVEEVNGDDFTLFIMDANIPSGPNSGVVSFFQESFIQISSNNYVKLDDLSKKEEILEKINDANLKNPLVKFSLDEDGSIHVNYFLNIGAGFKPEIVMTHMILIEEAMKKEFGAFMKIIWG